MVVQEVVVWTSDPDASRCLISVEKRPTSFGHDNEIVCDVILLLNSILNEDVVTLGVVNHIVRNPQVVSSMHCESSIERSVGCETFAVRFVHSSNHVEMNGISANFESLTDFIKFNVLQTSNEGVISFRMKEYGGTIFILV